MKPRTAISLVFVFFLTCCVRGDDLGRQSIELKKVRSDYQKATAELEAQFATLRGSGRYEIQGMRQERGLIRSFDIQFAKKPSMFKYVVTNHKLEEMQKKSNIPDQVSCSNRLISFSLSRALESNEFSITSKGEPNEHLKTIGYVSVPPFLDCAFAIAGRPLSKFFAEPTLALTKVEKIKHKGANMLKLYFHSGEKLPAGTTRGRVLSDAWVIVSPEDKWVAHQYEATFTQYPGGAASPVSMVGSVEYGESYAGVPIPRRAEYRHVYKVKEGQMETKAKNKRIIRDGQVADIVVFDFDHLDFEAEPDASFTLAAFGVPEVGKITGSRRGSGMNRFLLLSAALITVAAALKIYAAQRRKNTRRDISSSTP